MLHSRYQNTFLFWYRVFRRLNWNIGVDINIDDWGQAIREDAVVVPFNNLVHQTIASHHSIPASYGIWDGIHPSPAMHFLMAEKWLDCSGMIKKRK